MAAGTANDDHRHPRAFPVGGLLHEDPDEDNRRLFRQLRGHKRLLPVPVINPRLADWRASVARWAQKGAAVKILPSYHAYSLAGANVDGLAAELARRLPHLSIVALGVYSSEVVDLLRQAPRVWVDVSFLDGLDAVGVLVRKHRALAKRLLLGSHAPLFYTQAAVLKVQTAEATRVVRQGILGRNARTMLGL